MKKSTQAPGGRQRGPAGKRTLLRMIQPCKGHLLALTGPISDSTRRNRALSLLDLVLIAGALNNPRGSARGCGGEATPHNSRDSLSVYKHLSTRSQPAMVQALNTVLAGLLTTELPAVGLVPAETEKERAANEQGLQ